MDTDHIDYGRENYGQGYYGGPPPSEAVIIAQDGRLSLPHLVTDYSAQRQGRTVVHDTLDNSIAIVLAPARPRSGSMTFLYLTEADAQDAETLHASGVALWLAVPSRPTRDMRYAVVGATELRLDPDTRDHWFLTVPYQEIP